jgi:hypothetical protein
MNRHNICVTLPFNSVILTKCSVIFKNAIRGVPVYYFQKELIQSPIPAKVLKLLCIAFKYKI